MWGAILFGYGQDLPFDTLGTENATEEIIMAYASGQQATHVDHPRSGA